MAARVPAWGRRGGQLVLAVALTATGTVGVRQVHGRADGAPNPGTAKATALVSRIGPGVGNLELAVRGGVAVTQVTNALAQSTSQTADLGLIGTSLTATSCRGSQTFKPEHLPQPTSVDNRKGDAALRRHESRTDGAPFGLGVMEVSATKTPPTATATTTSTAFDLSPAVKVGGGTGVSVTKVLPGEGRSAEASVRSSIDLGGVVALAGLRWRAFHRTGLRPLAESSFDVGSATIGGIPFPADDTRVLESAVNTALAPLGAAIELPRHERFTEPTDVVRVTPLRIVFRDSPVGKALLGPGLDATRTGRGQLFDQLVAAFCDLASALLVADIVVTIVSGTGFLTMEIGGAEATSSDFEVGNPFGPPIAPDLPAIGDVPATARVRSGGGLAPSGPLDAFGVATSPGTPDVAAVPVLTAAARPGPLDEVCESVHPNRDGCRDGAALPLGLLAVLVVLAVGGADLLRQRRRAAGAA